MTIPEGWKVTELTLSANQEWSEWAKKQYKWNEEGQTVDRVIDGIQENFAEKLSAIRKLIKLNTSIPSATQINLRPFDMKTLKLERI